MGFAHILHIFGTEDVFILLLPDVFNSVKIQILISILSSFRTKHIFSPKKGGVFKNMVCLESWDHSATKTKCYIIHRRMIIMSHPTRNVWFMSGSYMDMSPCNVISECPKHIYIYPSDIWNMFWHFLNMSEACPGRSEPYNIQGHILTCLASKYSLMSKK